MRSLLCYASVGVLVLGLTASAQEAQKKAGPREKTTKATYVITGLHCAGCASTLEASLAKAKGVQSIKVDFATKNARLEFDESVVSAQQVAHAMSGTPHMMGPGMQYGGWLVLRVADMKDDATARKATEALRKVKGVAQAMAYPQQQAVAVQFAGAGNVTSTQLIEALGQAGLQGSQYGAEVGKTGAARSVGGQEGMAMANHAGMPMDNGSMAGMSMGGMSGHNMMCGCGCCR